MKKSQLKLIATTAREIVLRIASRGISISVTHVERIRRKLGYVKATTKYCHTISEANKEVRVLFCEEMLHNGTSFSDCVFTDECTIQVDCSTKFCFVQKGDWASRMRNRTKYPAKVHVWAGISSRGPINIVILPGTARINSEMSCRIIESAYLPFSQETYSGFALLVQDNASAHVSRHTKNQMKEWQFDVLDWSAESPDLNPVELV